MANIKHNSACLVGAHMIALASAAFTPQSASAASETALPSGPLALISGPPRPLFPAPTTEQIGATLCASLLIGAAICEARRRQPRNFRAGSSPQAEPIHAHIPGEGVLNTIREFDCTYITPIDLDGQSMGGSRIISSVVLDGDILRIGCYTRGGSKPREYEFEAKSVRVIKDGSDLLLHSEDNPLRYRLSDVEIAHERQ